MWVCGSIQLAQPALITTVSHSIRLLTYILESINYLAKKRWDPFWAVKKKRWYRRIKFDKNCAQIQAKNLVCVGLMLKMKVYIFRDPFSSKDKANWKTN